MQNNTKINLQQKFINDLNSINNGTTFGGYKASGFHNITHINPRTKRITFRRYTKDMNDTTKYLRNDLDCFFTINSFKTFYRNKNNVIGLNGIWADCDIEKNGITKRFFYNFLPDILEESQLFQPTYIIDSGHGFHLIFLFKHQIKVNHPVMLRLGDRLQEVLLKRLKKGIISICGNQASGVVDFQAKDRGRLLRVPGSNNLKHKKYKRLCRVIAYTGYYYDLYFLREELLDDYDSGKIARAKKYREHKVYSNNNYKISRQNLKFTKNPYTLSAGRLDDLYTLANLRHYNLHKMRETFLFMLSVFGIKSGLNKDDVIQRIEQMNNNYQYPLEQQELYNLEREINSNSTDFNNYRYYTMTIINILQINDEEQEFMKVLITKREKQSRRKQSRRVASNNYGSRKKKYIRNKKIKELHYKGISNRKIAIAMNLNRNTINRVVKKLFSN